MYGPFSFSLISSLLLKNSALILFEIKSFCFDVVMCELVHDMRTKHGLC